MIFRDITNTIKVKSSIDTFLSNNKDFFIDNEFFGCRLCCFKLPINSKNAVSDMKRHKNSILHQQNIKMINNSRERFEKGILNSECHQIEFLKMLVINNIPFKVVDNPEFKKFFNNLGFDIKSSNFYSQNLLKKCSTAKYNSIIDEFRNKDFYLILDETTDKGQKNILNILIGGINLNQFEKPKIVYSDSIHKVNSENIYKITDNLLLKILKFNFNINRFKLLITDGAPYCKKLGKLLKKKYIKLKHTICVCHNLHNFSEYVRNKFDLTNLLISELKRILHKNKVNQNIWNISTGIKMPSWPIVTRWGLWIETATYISKNFACIENFLFDNQISNQINPKIIVNKEQVRNELKKIIFYDFIPKIISSLEAQGLTLDVRIKILNDFRKKLVSVNDVEKFNNILSKNPDLFYFLNAVDKNLTEIIEEYLWAPLTSVDAERSFSKYRLLFTDNRRSLLPQTIFNLYLLLNS